jgi:hypothetical protein
VRAVEASLTTSSSPHSPARFQLIKEMRTVEVMPSEQELQQVTPAAASCRCIRVGCVAAEETLTCPISQAQMQQAVEAHEQLLSRGAMAHAVGAEVGRMLDYLSKELVRCVAAASASTLGRSAAVKPSTDVTCVCRYKEERRIAAMVMLAERQRRMREASEGGRRHDEIMKREQQDEVRNDRELRSGFAACA